MGKKVDFETTQIDDDLAWIDLEGKPNVDALLSAGGVTDPKDIKRATQEFKNSLALNVLRDIIRQRYIASQSKEALISDPTWPYQVAYREGYRKALKEIYQTIPIRNTDR